MATNPLFSGLRRRHLFSRRRAARIDCGLLRGWLEDVLAGPSTCGLHSRNLLAIALVAVLVPSRRRRDGAVGIGGRIRRLVRGRFEIARARLVQAARALAPNAAHTAADVPPDAAAVMVQPSGWRAPLWERVVSFLGLGCSRRPEGGERCQWWAPASSRCAASDNISGAASLRCNRIQFLGMDCATRRPERYRA